MLFQLLDSLSIQKVEMTFSAYQNKISALTSRTIIYDGGKTSPKLIDADISRITNMVRGWGECIYSLTATNVTIRINRSNETIIAYDQSNNVLAQFGVNISPTADDPNDNWIIPVRWEVYGKFSIPKSQVSSLEEAVQIATDCSVGYPELICYLEDALEVDEEGLEIYNPPKP